MSHNQLWLAVGNAPSAFDTCIGVGTVQSVWNDLKIVLYFSSGTPGFYAAQVFKEERQVVDWKVELGFDCVEFQDLLDAYRGFTRNEDGSWNLALDLDPDLVTQLEEMANREGIEFPDYVQKVTTEGLNLLIEKHRNQLLLGKKPIALSELVLIKDSLNLVLERFVDCEKFDADKFANQLIGSIESLSFLIEHRKFPVSNS